MDSLFCGKAGSWLFRVTDTKFTTTHFESLSMQNKKRYNINVISLLVVGEDGFEPSKS